MGDWVEKFHKHTIEYSERKQKTNEAIRQVLGELKIKGYESSSEETSGGYTGWKVNVRIKDIGRISFEIKLTEMYFESVDDNGLPVSSFPSDPLEKVKNIILEKIREVLPL